MDYTWSTIEFIGEKNFLNICQELKLEPDEIEIVRKTIGIWDELMVIPDLTERMRKKIEVMSDAIKDLLSEKQDRILLAQLKVNQLLVELRQKRQ